MNYDIEYLRKLMDELSDNSWYSQISEDDGDATTDTSSPTGGGGGSWKQPTKRKLGKTYMGPKYKWESGRVMGKTYSGPRYKWESGVTRGEANPLESIEKRMSRLVEQPESVMDRRIGIDTSSKSYTTNQAQSDDPAGRTNIDDAKTINTVVGQLKVPQKTITTVKKIDFTKPWGENANQMSTDNDGLYLQYILDEKNKKWVRTQLLDDLDGTVKLKKLYYPTASAMNSYMNPSASGFGPINYMEIDGVEFVFIINFKFTNTWSSNNSNIPQDVFNPTMDGMRGWTFLGGLYYKSTDGKFYPYNQNTFFYEEPSFWEEWGGVVIGGVSLIASVLTGGLAGMIILAAGGFGMAAHDYFVRGDEIGAGISIALTILTLGVSSYIKVGSETVLGLSRHFMKPQYIDDVAAGYRALQPAQKQAFRSVFQQSPQVLQKSVQEALPAAIDASAKKMGSKAFMQTVKAGVKDGSIVWERVPVAQRIAVQRAAVELGGAAALIGGTWIARQERQAEKMNKEFEPIVKNIQNFQLTAFANAADKSAKEGNIQPLANAIGLDINTMISDVSKLANETGYNGEDISKELDSLNETYIDFGLDGL